MKIHFERSGGFAGIRLAKTIDTTLLPAEQGQRLEQLVEEADFFHQPPNAGAGRGVDRFQFEVTVEQGGKQHTVRTSEETAPEQLRPLLRYLTEKAKDR